MVASARFSCTANSGIYREFPKTQKYPVSSNPLGENMLVMLDVTAVYYCFKHIAKEH